MELELAADADMVATLSRLKALNACRTGRPRTQALKIVWHDSAEHALLRDGLTLSEQRGTRRLERLLPAGATWLPAQPVPILGEPPDETELPAPLAPLAAFEGRQTVCVHQFGDQPVVVTVVRGVLRAVTAEHPAARVWLSGEDHAVRAAAALIGGAIPLTVPRACLAAEAIALATGRPAAPRHQGAPVLPPPVPPAEALTVAAALAHILGHLLDVIVGETPTAALAGDGATEAVHQMRVAVRRARSAVSIFRQALPDGTLETVNAGLKDLGVRLGPTRDWDVFAEETLPEILRALPNDKRLERLAAAADRRRREHRKALSDFLGSARFRMLAIDLAWFAAAGFWQSGAQPAIMPFAGTVLQHRWKRLVSAGKRIEVLDIPALHGVRLRAKRARYAAEMFTALYPGKAPQRLIRRLGVLQQRLGVLNDGAVATHLLSELGGPAGRHGYATGVVTGFLAARAVKIRPRIVRAFERFRRQPAYWA